MSDATTAQHEHVQARPATTSAGRTVTPLQVVEARREMELTVGMLARMADVSQDDVTAFEAGTPVGGEVVSALSGVLALGNPGVHVRTSPASPSHAKVMLRVREVARKVNGVGAVSDLAAWRTSAGWKPEATSVLKADLRCSEGTREGWVTGGAIVLLVASVATVANLVVHVVGAWGYVPLWMAALGLLACCARSHDEASARASKSKDAVRRQAAEDETNHSYERTGYVASPSGLSVVTPTDMKVVVHHPTETIYSVVGEEVSPGHVSITVGTTEGEVRMGWLPRSPALFAAMSSWTDDPTDLPWAPTVRIPA